MAKRKWRLLAPQIEQMSAEKAIVLALHHLEMAEAMFNCIEPERRPELQNIDEDIPDEWKESSDIRRRFCEAALAARYRGKPAFTAAAAAFLNALTNAQDEADREFFGRMDNLPIVDIDDTKTN